MRDDLDIPYPAAGSVQGSDYTPRDYRAAGKMDPNTRRLAIISGGIGGALLLLMGVWSVTGHKHTGVPVVEADSRPVREKPVNKGGLQVAGADETIMSGDAEGKTVVAPLPEAPAIAALKAMPPAPPVAELPPVPQAAATRVAGLQEVPSGGVVNASRPAAPTAPAPAPRVATAQPVAPRAEPNVGIAKSAVAHPGTAQVQLAAVGSEQAAMGEWQRLSHKFPEMLGNRHPAVSRTDHDGKIYYRLRVSGFSDLPSATAFCGQLKAKGGTCAPASF